MLCPGSLRHRHKLHFKASFFGKVSVVFYPNPFKVFLLVKLRLRWLSCYIFITGLWVLVVVRVALIRRDSNRVRAILEFAQCLGRVPTRPVPSTRLVGIVCA